MQNESRNVAASDLLSEIGEKIEAVFQKIERAECIHQDLTEGYFGKSRIEDDLCWLHAQYYEHQTKANIVGDYMTGAREMISVIIGMVMQAEQEFKAELIINQPKRKVSLEEAIRKAEEQE